MGNINWNLEQFPYSQYQWIPAQNPYTLICPYDQTEANYQIIASPTQNDIKCYTLRSEYQECLVAVLAILSEQVNTNIRCQKRNLYKILIEKIDYRLPDLGMISFVDGIYIIRQGIEAVKALNSIFNNFYFEDQNIGINCRGNCKYWINTNFFNNTVQSIFEEEPNLSADHKLYAQNILGSFLKQDGRNEDDFCFMSNSANKNNPQQYGQRYRKAKNISKTLQNLYNKIYEKMQYQMASEHLQLLNQCKNKFLSTPALYTNSNNFLQFQQSKTPTYNYSIQNMQKLINHLYKILNIKQNHCINIPQKEQKKSNKIKLNKGFSYSLQKCKRQISNTQINYNYNNSKQLCQKLNNSKKSNSNQSKSQIKRNYKNYRIISNTKTSLKKIRISDSKPPSINDVNSAKQHKITGYPTSNSSFHHHQASSSKPNPSKPQHKQKITYIYEQQQNQKEAALQSKDEPKIGQKNYYSNIIYKNMPEIRKENGFSQITLKSTANSFTSNFCISNGQFNMESRKISVNGENMIKMDSNRMFIQTQPTLQQHYKGSTNSNVLNQKANSKKIVFTSSSPVNVTFFNKPIDNLGDSSHKSYFNERESEQIAYSQSVLTVPKKLQPKNNDHHTYQKCHQNPAISFHHPSQIPKPNIRLTYGIDNTQSYKSVPDAPSPIRKLRSAI